jgi:hypothetical protein
LKSRWLLLGLGLLLALLVAAAVRGVVAEFVVAPLLYLGWGTQTLFASLPQALPWTLLVLAGIVLAATSLPAPRLPALARRSPTEASGRVAEWRRLISLTTRDEYSRWRAAQRVAHIAVEALAEREHGSPQQARRLIEGDALAVPDDVRAYLRAGLNAYQPQPGARGRIVRGGPLDVELRRILDWIEQLV